MPKRFFPHLFFFGVVLMGFGQLPREKIYLHLDKNQCVPGDTLRFKAYLVDAITHTADTQSKVVYVDLINPDNDILATTTTYVDALQGHGKLFLPKNAMAGRYQIRAYTNYMRNFDPTLFFRKRVHVGVESDFYVKEDSPKAIFNPEGGQLLANEVNRIGVRLSGLRGNVSKLSGKVLDQSGILVTEFSISPLGTGIIQFIPQIGKHYKAVIEYPVGLLVYEMPKVQETGILMKLDEWSDHYRISLKFMGTANTDSPQLGTYQRKGLVYGVKLSNNDEILVKIPKESFETGPIQWLLTNNSKEILASRASFHGTIRADQPIKVQIEDLDNQTKRFTIAASNVDDQTVSSLSINVQNTSRRGWYGLWPYLQLQSDYRTRQNVLQHFPEYQRPDWKRDLNNLMLSLDGKKLVYHTIFNNTTSVESIAFWPEKGTSVRGKVTGPDGQGVSATVSMAYKSATEIGQMTTQTDTLGRFIFRDCMFFGETDILLEAKNTPSNVNPSDLEIVIIPQKPPEVLKSSVEGLETVESVEGEYQDFLTDRNSIALDEVTVSDEKISAREKEKRRRRLLYKNPSGSVDFNDIIIHQQNDILLPLIGKIRGARRTPSGGIILRSGETLSGQGTRSPLILLDGTPVTGDIPNAMLVSEVDFIDVLSGTQAAIYGSRAANGFIAIYARIGPPQKEKSQERQSNTTSFVLEGMENESNNRDTKTEENTETFSKVATAIDSLEIGQAEIEGKAIALDEVQVKATKIAEREVEKNERRLLYKKPTYHLDLTETTINPNENLALALAGRIPGIRTKSDMEGNIVPVLRGENNLLASSVPLILVDGTPVSVDAMSQLLPEEVDFIDILIGPRAAIYGSRAANGVIAIYTKRAEKPRNAENLRTNKTASLLTGMEVSATTSNDRMLVATVPYWNPNLQISAKHNLVIVLEDLVKAHEYSVYLKALGPDGHIIEKHITFKVD